MTLNIGRKIKKVWDEYKGEFIPSERSQFRELMIIIVMDILDKSEQQT
jgi:hypothetical protein